MIKSRIYFKGNWAVMNHDQFMRTFSDMEIKTTSITCEEERESEVFQRLVNNGFTVLDCYSYCDVCNTEFVSPKKCKCDDSKK